jgi:hypothetical protein
MIGWFSNIGKRSWSLFDIINTFIDLAKEFRIDEKDSKLIIEVVIDEKNSRIFEEYRYGYNSCFYER